VRVARALSVVAVSAVLRRVVIAATVQEVTSEDRVAGGRAVAGRRVLVAFTIEEILAVCRRVVTTKYSTDISRISTTVCGTAGNAIWDIIIVGLISRIPGLHYGFFSVSVFF